jgi:hypothetical protein
MQKMIPLETIPGTRRGGMKKSRVGGECQYDIFDTL